MDDPPPPQNPAPSAAPAPPAYRAHKQRPAWQCTTAAIAHQQQQRQAVEPVAQASSSNRLNSCKPNRLQALAQQALPCTCGAHLLFRCLSVRCLPPTRAAENRRPGSSSATLKSALVDPPILNSRCLSSARHSLNALRPRGCATVLQRPETHCSADSLHGWPHVCTR